ncbi:class I SAM-dependent methyltransferase [Pseudonocardia abyssalis]|uniref:Class I SAM-dependent methyltransferase n=1 Tax=Pseudonocardia abyssalis TaxID=2792008 RepID=A0ABS6UZM6_9PSEU|nr:methyltransferase domain-containing protein [Pseudonocardia abyssalis]MBW0114537.1 class I SAM-dependent methyltransferase [Pseudonocardia abyssalis]MBW0137700.1 class I SAM-dependent methyltransferase [Pseudonocardia abyssalis]
MEQWRTVDEGWGRRAADFATLMEPAAVREYLHVHRLLGIGPGSTVLDMACGSGLAMELARLTGAEVSGVDASVRLAAVAALRNPDSRVVVGDMAEPHFPASSFDAVTSFRGIWATTPGAIAQARRVLRPGGRVAITFWGEMAASQGGPLFAPFRLATPPQVDRQSDMVALKRPGVAAEFLAAAGLEPGELFDVPFVLEFADAEHYARGLASTGPGYEAVVAAGEEAFRDACLQAAAPFVRTGLPIRATLQLRGIIGTAPA